MRNKSWRFAQLALGRSTGRVSIAVHHRGITGKVNLRLNPAPAPHWLGMLDRSSRKFPAPTACRYLLPLSRELSITSSACPNARLNAAECSIKMFVPHGEVPIRFIAGPTKLQTLGRCPGVPAANQDPFDLPVTDMLVAGRERKQCSY